jgi:plasmid stabilization system protein ParE
MKRGYFLRRVAAREFDKSIAWYEKQREGLGKEFRATIEEYFHRIVTDPEHFPKVRGEVRRAVVLRRFPFVIHFVTEARQVVILSVFHTSRDPQKLKYRH